jgi:hypothetical protein
MKTSSLLSWAASGSLTTEDVLYADLFYSALLVLFLGYAIHSTRVALHGRMEPSNSVRIDARQTSFQMPYISICLVPHNNSSSVVFTSLTLSNCSAPGCNPSPLNVETFSSAYEGDTLSNCLKIYDEHAYIDTSKYLFPQFSFSGSVSALAFLFVTPFDPTTRRSFDDDETYFMWHYIPYSYMMKFSKRVYKNLKTSADGFSTAFKTLTTYNVFPSYTGALPECAPDASGVVSSCSAWLYLFADKSGVGYYADIDPLDMSSLIGSMGGAFNYVTLAFSFVFGSAILRKWRLLERNHMERIAEHVTLRMRHADTKGVGSPYVSAD